MVNATKAANEKNSRDVMIFVLYPTKSGFLTLHYATPWFALLPWHSPGSSPCRPHHRYSGP